MEDLSKLPVIKLLCIIELESTSTGEIIFEKFVKELFGNEFEIQANLVAICHCQCTNLISSKDAGLTNRL